MTSLALSTSQKPLLIPLVNTPGGVGVPFHPAIKAAGDIIDKSMASCGKFAIATHCAGENKEHQEHHFAKELYCGMDWCPTCGQKESHAHMRRVSRWLPKAQQVKYMGYLVVEFSNEYRFRGRTAEYLGDPNANYEDIRGYCYSREALRHTTDVIVDTLRGRGMGRKGLKPWRFERGMGRWHWFGEEGLNGWNPHFNVLLDASVHASWHNGGFHIGAMPKRSLNALKIALHEALGMPYDLDDKGIIKNPTLIVRYDYSDAPGKMYHWTKYVTRPTFLDREWEPYMARELFGRSNSFRNSRVFGLWKDAPAWEFTAAVEEDAKKLEELDNLMTIHDNQCPDCDCELLPWTKAFSSKWLNIWKAEPMGDTGYYRLPSTVNEPGLHVTPEMAARLEELERQRKQALEENYPVYREAYLSSLFKQPGEEGFFSMKDLRILKDAYLFRTYPDRAAEAGDSDV